MQERFAHWHGVDEGTNEECPVGDLEFHMEFEQKVYFEPGTALIRHISSVACVSTAHILEEIGLLKGFSDLNNRLTRERLSSEASHTQDSSP